MITKALKSKDDYLKIKKNNHTTVTYIDAQKAIEKTDYFCPFCGTTMFKKTSTNGIPFYCCRKNMKHSNSICIRLSRKHDIADTDIPDFDPKLFFAGIITPKKNINNTSTDNDSVNEKCPSNINSTSPEVEGIYFTSDELIDDSFNSESIMEDTDIDTAIDVFEVVPARKISDIIDLGYHRQSCNSDMNSSKKIKVKDLIIALPSLGQLINGTVTINDTDRIIEMRPSSLGDQVICRAFCRDSAGNYENVYFRLITDSKEQNTKLKNKLFIKPKRIDGSSKIESKYSSIFVCGHWTLSDTPYTFKGQAYICYDTSIHNIRTQIYCLPNE
ncbi:MAG: hypothetical protein K5750_05250 [Eubacterium sp.]|nr:hypothetical protein [Eubacterium sp.]